MSSPKPWLSTEAAVARRILLVVAAAVVLIWLILRVEVVAVAAFLGFAQTAMLWPLTKALRRVLPAGLAALIVVGLYGAFIAGLLWFVGVELANSWDGLVNAVVSGADTANDWLQRTGISLSPDILDTLQTQARSQLSNVFSGVGTVALGGISVLSTMATILVVATFATLFCLASGDALWRSVLGALHPQRRAAVDSAFRAGFKTARWWMFASTATGLVDALFIGLGLWILGVPFLLPIMVLTFILGFIPMVGATVAGAIAVAVALFSGGVSTALWALLVVVAVQQIEGNVLSPLLLSRAMEFHPVVTLLLATSGGLALGLTGLFLTVPVAGVLVAMRKGWFRVTRDADDRDDHDGDGVDDDARPPASPERDAADGQPESDAGVAGAREGVDGVGGEAGADGDQRDRAEGDLEDRA